MPVLVLGVFFVLPVSRHGRARASGRTAGSTPAAVLEVLARPRVHRVLWFTLWSSAAVATLLAVAARAAGGVRPAPARAARAGRLVRAALLVPFVLPTVVVGVAFRQLLGEGGPLGFLGLDGTPVAIVAGLVFFNVAVVVRAVGVAWESLDPRPAQAAAALGASPWQVLRTVTLPALRPAIVGAASVVFLFCATAFGIVLTLGGVRYATVETEIYLLTTTRLRPAGGGRAVGAAARRRGRRCWRSPRGCARRPTRRPTARSRPAAPSRPRRRARRSSRRCCVLAAMLAADRHPGRRLAARRRRLGARTTTARSPPPATTRRCWCR